MMIRSSILFLFLCGVSLAQKNDHHLLFVSDTQQPLWIETLRLNSNNNEEATRKIYSAILSDTNATALFHLGDFTAIGMFGSYWKDFDDFKKQLRIPIYPVLGNHDYYIFSGRALGQFYKRFPGVSSWYSTVINGVAVIALNSNFSQLADSEHIRQQTWFHEQLGKFDADSSVSSIIVVCHHSPYTNSQIVSPNIDVQNEFVTPFMTYQKSRVFISGHAHAYEHFQKNGKEFLVIGGGGGLLHPLLTGKDEVFRDAYNQAQSPRFFHYVDCTIRKESLQFIVKKLRNDQTGFENADTITVSLHK